MVQEAGSKSLAPEPFEEKGPVIEVAIFFDGTNNDRNRDRPKGCDTNVSKLYDLFDHDDKTRFKLYFEGVGTKSTFSIDKYSGGFSGTGAQNRIDRATKALKDLIARFPKSEFKVSIFGFSRGAATSMAFVNHLFSVQNVPVLESGKTGADAKPFSWPFEKIWFMGLFDAVASFGMPGDDDEGKYDVSLKYSGVRKVVHLVSKHERRALFPLSSIRSAKDAPLPSGFVEITFPGVHADIGGGYQDEDATVISKGEGLSENVHVRSTFSKHDYLSRVPGWAMYDAAKSAGLTMHEIAENPDEADEATFAKLITQGGAKNAGFKTFRQIKATTEPIDIALNNLAIPPQLCSLWDTRNNPGHLSALTESTHPDYARTVEPFIHDSFSKDHSPDLKKMGTLLGKEIEPRTIFFRGRP
jgi:hypothetical protein